MFYTSAGLAQRQAVSGEANFSEHASRKKQVQVEITQHSFSKIL
jgi:hypothetical protein